MFGEVTSFRFGTIRTEFVFSARTPKVGEKVKRGDEEWVVTAVERDADGNVVVTLAPAATAE